ncbi:probable tRNA N6-adenosine threonylcarbamoyltransferase, mitochondrial [Chrysoperla carnea]|uniref:probable tRNA N6-adenosine threonylcarbamoyltransferase, mitochondrial n=1 Tax=Chrysoperla carnea TaxID=189513 RepID=UPI001D061539|nr:probable tRNA N6-adenosine threonylcarbamoyltransferase, mitochondrial [Chrysoperla carnea]
MYKNLLKYLLNKNAYVRNLSTRSIILGIETSCDDTGCAVVDTDGNILGEALKSQQQLHLNHGGIIPPIAQSLHRENIESVVNDAIEAAGVSFKDVDAIATTVKPGLPLSLLIGMKYGKHLCRKYNKPFIPIHHMEAHALTVRLFDKNIQFPFLVLLISGGHCLISIVKNVDEFLLLGKSLDDAPGEALDKTARRLKMHHIPEYKGMSGGQSIEEAAKKATDILQFDFPLPLTKYRDCNFSFSGLKNTALRYIKKQEKIHDLAPDVIIPDINNLCAGFQLAITRHLCHRVQRSMQYLNMKQLIPKDKQTLVVSGGAACNNFISKALQIVCNEMGYKLVRPPPKLCTDNGIMIAWNGVERWKQNCGIFEDLSQVDIQGKCTLGVNMIDDVVASNIQCKWIKLTSLYK